MRPMPTYPVVQCLNGTHPPYDITEHPNGCPAHLQADRAREASTLSLAGREAVQSWIVKGIAQSTIQSDGEREALPWVLTGGLDRLLALLKLP